MAVFDHEQQRIVLRVVYDGAARAGKTTNVRLLNSFFTSRKAGEIIVPREHAGRTLYFDWMDLDGGLVAGQRLRCQFVTVPGQRRLAARRKKILQTADVVVLVCSSALRGRNRARAMLDSLRWSLRSVGKESIPIILQANKQDLRTAISPDALREALEMPQEVSVVGATAHTGVGVRETAVLAIRAAAAEVQQQLVEDGMDAIVGRAGRSEDLQRELEDLPLGGARLDEQLLEELEQDHSDDEDEEGEPQPPGADQQPAEDNASAAPDSRASGHPVPNNTDEAAAESPASELPQSSADERPAEGDVAAAAESPASQPPQSSVGERPAEGDVAAAAESPASKPPGPSADEQPTGDEASAAAESPPAEPPAAAPPLHTQTAEAAAQEAAQGPVVDFTVSGTHTSTLPPTWGPSPAPPIDYRSATQQGGASATPDIATPYSETPQLTEPSARSHPPAATPQAPSQPPAASPTPPAVLTRPPDSGPDDPGAPRPLQWPSADVPSGCVWPSTTGRNILREVKVHDVVACPELAGRAGTEDGSGADDLLIYRAGPWCLKTSMRRRYNSTDDGRHALLDLARSKILLGELLPPRTVVSAEYGDDDPYCWVWTVTPWMLTLRAEMADAAGGRRDLPLATALARFAGAAVSALVLAARAGVRLDVHPSNFATHDQILCYIDDDIERGDTIPSIGHALLQRVEEYATRPEAIEVYLDAIEKELREHLQPAELRALQIQESLEVATVRQPAAVEARRRLLTMLNDAARRQPK